MKIYVSHFRGFDFEKELLEPLRASELATRHQFFFPHEGGASVNTREEIKNTDLVLAEVSFPATGQGIELGWANADGKKIICISRESAKVAGSLKYISDTLLSYSDTNDMVNKLKEQI